MSTPQHTHRPHLLRPFPFGPVGAPGVAVWVGDIYLAGWVLTESTGAAAAAVQLVDGGDANGVPLATINLAIGQTVQGFLGGHLLVCQTGLFVRVTAGSVVGDIYAADR